MANTCILVIGPCRSGTSVCAGLLDQLGCDMGGQGEVSTWNPKGNYTDPEFDYYLRCVYAQPTNTTFTGTLAAYLKARDQLPIWGVKHYLLAGKLITWMTTNLTSTIKIVYTTRAAADSANSLNALRGGNGTATAADTAFIAAMNTWIATAQAAGGILAPFASMTVSYSSIFSDPTDTVANLAAFAGVPNNPSLASWITGSFAGQSVRLAQEQHAATVPERNGDCVHLGLPVFPAGQRSDVNGDVCECRGKWLMRCDLHGQCTISQERPQVAFCQTCSDYEQ